MLRLEPGMFTVVCDSRAGKLQQLAVLLGRLKAEGSRCLIFTQMSKMLDVLEAFLNLHSVTYMRLDGSTKPAQRQELMTRFNSDPRFTAFILSTRSGGVGINLTGANCVIFYDSDWNPAMDQQAQVRCACCSCCDRCACPRRTGRVFTWESDIGSGCRMHCWACCACCARGRLCRSCWQGRVAHQRTVKSTYGGGYVCC